MAFKIRQNAFSAGADSVGGAHDASLDPLVAEEGRLGRVCPFHIPYPTRRLRRLGLRGIAPKIFFSRIAPEKYAENYGRPNQRLLWRSADGRERLFNILAYKTRNCICDSWIYSVDAYCSRERPWTFPLGLIAPLYTAATSTGQAVRRPPVQYYTGPNIG